MKKIGKFLTLMTVGALSIGTFSSCAPLEEILDKVDFDGSAIKTPYDLALENGFEGTMQEWLESLVGPKGEKGDTGAQGEQGIQGEKGDTGAQGEQGIQGEKGEQGAQGDQGIQGEKGEQGIQGEKGEQGAQGEQGIQGEKGEQGAQGEQGIQGEKGEQGVGIADISISYKKTDDGKTIMVFTITYTDGSTQIKESTMPTLWDGTSATNKEDLEKNEDGAFVVDTPAEFVGALQNISDEEHTIVLTSDIYLNNAEWTPITVSAYTNSNSLVIHGNGNTIYGLTDMLVGGAAQGVPSVEIYDLTIANSNIEHDVNDEKGTVGVGAFVGMPDGGVSKVILSNCHLIDSKVSGGHWTGGLIGYAAGYSDVTNGACFMDVTIVDCSVKNSIITGQGSCGAIIGHATGSAWTKVTIGNCQVIGNVVTSTGDSTNKAGALMGTVGCAGFEENGKVGGVYVTNALIEENTVLSNEVINTKLYGRQGSPTGRLFVNGEEIVFSDAILETALKANQEHIVVSLVDNLSLDVNDAYIKLGGEDTQTITINGNGNTLTLSTTYWSSLNLVNPNAKLIINNATVTSTQPSGTWDSYDVTFSCNVELNNVIFDKAVALEGNTSLLKNVKITETHDYYALWIRANGQTVTLEDCEIESAGRGIKIDEEYVTAPAKVTLNVKNCKFTTAKKAAIMVKSVAGAQINIDTINIENVTADKTNSVWVDEDSATYAELVTVTGATKIIEGQ